MVVKAAEGYRARYVLHHHHHHLILHHHQVPYIAISSLFIAFVLKGQERVRCFGDHNPLYAKYHDEEWGVPVHNDRVFFEFLILEGAQAGLSWETILRKRENYRKAFAGFDPAKVARFTPEKTRQLMQDEGIVRNRLKIDGAVKNAKAFLAVQKEFGSFDNYVWRFAPRPTPHAPRTMKDVPATTPESDALSRDLKKRGFTFVGSTIIYAFMQATGLVNDHAAACPVRKRDRPGSARGTSTPPSNTGTRASRST